LRFITAGESHGPQLTAIIDGLPAGFAISAEDINKELARRQIGYGRGDRMKIEKDRVQIMSGVRHGKTLGSPITLVVENKDWKNWTLIMDSEEVPEKQQQLRKITQPRPGHADLVGGIKYHHQDLRNVLERSSARETAIRVAIGAICKKLLKDLAIEITSHVVVLGGIQIEIPEGLSVLDIQTLAEASDLRIVNPQQEADLKTLISTTKTNGDTLGGIIETLVSGVPAGLGSYVHWDRKLDGKIAQALTSINGFKGVQFGIGFEMAHQPGSQVMDEILWNQDRGYSRRSNHLGGFEGGMTNGELVIVQSVMKPIPTLYRPLQSVDINSKDVTKASVERSDTTAVPAASVVSESVVATEIVKALLEKFPHDTFTELKTAVTEYRKYTKSF